MKKFIVILVIVLMSQNKVFAIGAMPAPAHHALPPVVVTTKSIFIKPSRGYYTYWHSVLNGKPYPLFKESDRYNDGYINKYSIVYFDRYYAKPDNSYANPIKYNDKYVPALEIDYGNKVLVLYYRTKKDRDYDFNKILGAKL